MRYSVPVAQKMGKMLADWKVFWFEEPFAPEDIDSFVALRGSIPVRIAAGENEFGTQGFRELIRARAVDIVQADASRCGGISEVKKVCEMARQANVGVATHSWSDAVAVIANAHVIAAVDNGITVEIDQTGNPFIEDLLVEPLRVVDGEIRLSSQPGLGIELREETIDKYRWNDPLHLPDGCYSDMIFGKRYLTG